MRRSSNTRSASSAVDAMLNASLPPMEPPAHVRLRPQDRRFWDAIILARARSEWIDSDLALAAQLARLQSDIEREAQLVELEGVVASDRHGNPCVNPRAKALDMMTRRQVMLARALKIGAITMDRPDLEKARRLERASRSARASLPRMDAEGLLAQ